MKTVRWGLISTANINRRLIPPIRASKRGTLAAVASRDLAKARDYAREWGIKQAFGSYEEMLESDAVDAVYISLPNHLHAEWSIKALRAGKHVLCEKPFAISLEEVDAMIAAQQETGLALMEAFMYRHHPQNKMIGEWVREGKVGDVTLIRGSFSFYMGDQPGNVRLNPDWGGGALWDVGVYPLSYAQFIYGELPESVSGQQHIGKSGVDETFAGLLRYSGGRSAIISCGFETPHQTSIEIHGTGGRIALTRPFTGMNERGREITYTAPDGKAEKLHTPGPDPYLCEVENMQDAVLDGKPTYVTLAESRNHIRTALALYESARTGREVRLESVGSNT